MSTIKQPEKYIAFLLRCWLEEFTWRYSREEVGSRKKHGFATLDEFVSFLLARSMSPNDEAATHSMEVHLKEINHRAGLEVKSSSCDDC